MRKYITIYKVDEFIKVFLTNAIRHPYDILHNLHNMWEYDIFEHSLKCSESGTLVTYAYNFFLQRYVAIDILGITPSNLESNAISDLVQNSLELDAYDGVTSKILSKCKFLFPNKFLHLTVS